MRVLVDPDELKSSANIDFNLTVDVSESSGLEALTGADFVITPLPIPLSSATLALHIKAKAMFVQRKSGYDVLSFKQLLRAQARMQECKIPYPQAVLLIIGTAWEDDDGMLRMGEWNPFGDVTYKTYLSIRGRWITRGGSVHNIDKQEQLQDWIDVQSKIMTKNENRDIYPHVGKIVLDPENIWERAKEIPPDDVRFFMCAGMKGFGPKLAQATDDYIKSQISHVDGYGLYYIKVLTDETADGKAVHGVKGWGKKKRRELRSILSLASGYNIEVKDISDDTGRQFANAWFSVLRAFKDYIESGMSGTDAWNSLMLQANEFFKEEGIK